MAEALLASQSLVIKYKAGIDKEGKDVFRRQGFSNISNEATVDNLSAVGHAIGDILYTQICSVLKEESFELMG
ncbi:DUF1659 domain-containing protein [Clostridium paridis]|uniref:DUF1659 domain-containing protein n=1 Tax=Clostridium paridis TaxID=2803863 RepID=A0A937FGP6_9CLOT|nr:DUF1659 domain-containing protein [Clostridium paridis]MBL4933049.1 DUF1659 domain-containing protein [Clostridium paridis]